MKLQYCEDGIHPRVLIGITEITIKDKVLDIVHSGGYVECTVAVLDSSLLYLEADEKIRIQYCDEAGKIKLNEIVNDHVVIRFKEDVIIIDSIHMEKSSQVGGHGAAT